MLYQDHYRLLLHDILDKPNSNPHMLAVIAGAQAARPMTRFITDGTVRKDMWELLPKDFYLTKTAQPWSALVLGIKE
jgi:hypothetical protein